MHCASPMIGNMGAGGSYTPLDTDIMVHLHKYTNNYKPRDRKCIDTRRSAWLSYLRENRGRVPATWAPGGPAEHLPLIKTSAYLTAKWNVNSATVLLHENKGDTLSACVLCVTTGEPHTGESRCGALVLLGVDLKQWRAGREGESALYRRYGGLVQRYKQYHLAITSSSSRYVLGDPDCRDLQGLCPARGDFHDLCLARSRVTGVIGSRWPRVTAMGRKLMRSCWSVKVTPRGPCCAEGHWGSRLSRLGTRRLPVTSPRC
ncbi:hypothetical protein E2C01_058122 [Portunus trituberculatus]|uniref:Uncharacterized protein n=1 Tax=Portunus trituberculatus TaxID=210409 RepID=A0A5B7GYS5_PORTR|nr:hypothetical protein [Portunus trituberculatus]